MHRLSCSQSSQWSGTRPPHPAPRPPPQAAAAAAPPPGVGGNMPAHVSERDLTTAGINAPAAASQASLNVSCHSFGPDGNSSFTSTSESPTTTFVIMKVVVRSISTECSLTEFFSFPSTARTTALR